jgi:hypothetical protein
LCKTTPEKKQTIPLYDDAGTLLTRRVPAFILWVDPSFIERNDKQPITGISALRAGDLPNGGWWVLYPMYREEYQLC